MPGIFIGHFCMEEVKYFAPRNKHLRLVWFNLGILAWNFNCIIGLAHHICCLQLVSW